MEFTKYKCSGLQLNEKTFNLDYYLYLDNVKEDSGFGGYIYVLKLSNGNIKIGKTLDIKRRLKSLKNMFLKCNVYITEYAISKKYINYDSIEEYFHVALKEYNVTSEITTECYNIDYQIFTDTLINYIEWYYNYYLKVIFI